MDKQIYLQTREVEDKHWWFAGRRMIIKHMIESLKLPQRSAILDVGCGTGGNLALLSEFGNVMGVELDDRALELACGRRVGKVLKGSLPDGMPFETQFFDLICILDVLEHIEDDLSSLRSLKTLLTPKGYMLLTVPAFPFLWGQHDMEHHHKRRYQATALQRIIQKAGLKIKHLTYYNTWLFPVVVISRILRQIVPSKQVGADVQIPNCTVNKLLQAVFGSERHLVNRMKMPFGVSILAVLQKG
ncbi:MAG: hypothetical protein BBJ57_01150 [Desulfobacterales bacterium PC51MH44]|nr:MAG: hypothetical protein BBJ57_01150 [Desulfobacterales bacterium PC51MH44]